VANNSILLPLFCLGNALKKAGGEAFEEEVENLAKDKSPLDVAEGKFTQLEGPQTQCKLHSSLYEKYFITKINVCISLGLG
jgi:hypothetical protein